MRKKKKQYFKKKLNFSFAEPWEKKMRKNNYEVRK